MDITSLREVPVDGSIETDVCIVGSGPAGLTLAAELAGSGLGVVVVESGSAQRTDFADALNEIVSSGAPRQLETWGVRNRVLGGASATWSGRLATFDEVDFAPRSWVPHSGWPVDRADLAPYFERSLALLGSHVPDNNAPAVVEAVRPRWAGVDPGVFRPYAWTYSRDAADDAESMRFGPRALTQQLPGLRCLVDATVTQVLTDDSARRVRGVEVRTPEGSVHEVRAARVVLSAGGIENARLLLTSDRVTPHGLGNDHDQVGRHLMDHPRDTVGTFPKAQQYAVQRLFDDVLVDRRGRGSDLVVGMALTPEVQRREQLLNCALFTHPGEIDDDDPLRGLRDVVLLRNPRRGAAAFLGNPGIAALDLRERVVRRRPSSIRARTEITLQCIVEQRPDPDSRVTLADRTDAHGTRLPDVHWRISEQEARTVRYATRTFAAELARTGRPVPVLTPMVTDDDAEFVMPDIAHATGTTRMSTDPRQGVVDVDCQVHGVDGLYAAGSSVFPTSGHANPTQMIVALAIRLADHLRRTAAP